MGLHGEGPEGPPPTPMYYDGVEQYLRHSSEVEVMSGENLALPCSY